MGVFALDGPFSAKPKVSTKQDQLHPASTTWSNAAWIFFDTPSQLLANATNWNGFYSACAQCSIARMTTIGNQYHVPDGSCFGNCSAGGPSARWDEVVAGQIIQPCDQISNAPDHAECTIEYTSSWQAGENSSCDGTVVSEYTQQAGLEGLNQNNSGCSTNQADQGKFKAPPLPTAPATPCPADSHGYCSDNFSSTLREQCDLGYKNVHGQEMYLDANTKKYYIFKQQSILELQETATDSQSVNSKAPCVLTDSWSPADPKTTYSDPYLP